MTSPVSSLTVSVDPDRDTTTVVADGGAPAGDARFGTRNASPARKLVPGLSAVNSAGVQWNFSPSASATEVKRSAGSSDCFIRSVGTAGPKGPATSASVSV